MIKKLALALLAVGFVAVSIQAATPAFDEAGNAAYQADDANGSNDTDPANNTNGWVAGDNGGTGFGAWTFNSSGGGGRYVGATGNEPDPSFGIFSATTTASDFFVADRPFTGALAVGDTFSLQLGATGVATSGVIGLNLLNGATEVFSFRFTGGQTNWVLNDGGSNFETTIPFAANTPITLAFTYNGGSGYDIFLQQGATVYDGNGFTATSDISNITGVRFFSTEQGTNENMGFNDLAIAPIPEPSSLSLLAGPAILAAWFFVRRRRA